MSPATSYAYNGSDPRTAVVVESVRDAIAPFFTANDDISAAAQCSGGRRHPGRIIAEQVATINRLIDELRLEREQVRDPTLRLERLAA